MDSRRKSLSPSDWLVGGGEMGERIRAMDWSETPLGPREQWPQSLRIPVNVCLNSRFPMFVWWGPDHINLYNDAYIPMLGKRHPQALGKPARETWADIWSVVGPQGRAVLERGEATWNERVLLVMERHGYTEETYFTWSYSPIYDESGKVAGLFCAVTEDTARVMAERERDRLAQQTRTILESITDAFFALGKDWRFTYVNPRAERVLDRKDLLGKEIWEEYPGLVGSEFERVYRGAAEEHVAGSVTSFYPDHDRWYEVHAYPAADGGISVYFRDATRRKRDEQLLAAQNKALELVATGAPLEAPLGALTKVVEEQSDGDAIASILLVSEDGCSLRTGAAPGLPAEYNAAVDGIRIACDVGTCADAAARNQIVCTPDIAAAPSWKGLAHLPLGLGLKAAWSMPIRASDGRVLGTFGTYFRVCREPTERERQVVQGLCRVAALVIEQRRVEEQLRQAKRAAERASDAKSEFLATLSHELRTPLTPVMLTISLIESHPGLPPELREDVGEIRRNVELESRLISDLLDLTRIANGKMHLDMQDVDLHRVVRSAIDICQRQASAKLSTDLHAPRHTVHGDATRLQQIFWNLINNAIKFTPQDATITVRSTDAGEGRVRVEVIDTGAGIDPAVFPRLFTAFEQGEVRESRQQAGLGLGLAISRKLAEAHGGTIWARSEGRGHGATFSVELPVVQPEVVAPAAPAAPPVLQTATRPMNVLLVEDHEPSLRAMERLLRRIGHRVTGVTSVASATATASRDGFDLIISDLGLPDGSGLDVMRHLRDRYAGRAIALTGYGMESDIAASREAGFAEHLTKPVDFDALRAAIHRLASR